jgi:hypothetical protein
LEQDDKVLPHYDLTAQTRWPITGGMASRVASSGDQGGKKMNILLTGHKTGIVQAWDAFVTSNMTYPYNGSLGDG